MTNQMTLTLGAAKDQAKRLRTSLAQQGNDISHSAALELVAQQHGHRDWNSLHAAIGNRPPETWSIGDRVQGAYLKQPFDATVIGVSEVGPAWVRLTLDFDEPVDVVTFDSFSSYRKRVRCVIGPDGVSTERTSDGAPHMRLSR